MDGLEFTGQGVQFFFYHSLFFPVLQDNETVDSHAAYDGPGTEAVPDIFGNPADQFLSAVHAVGFPEILNGRNVQKKGFVHHAGCLESIGVVFPLDHDAPVAQDTAFIIG